MILIRRKGEKIDDMLGHFFKQDIFTDFRNGTKLAFEVWKEN